MDGSEEEGLEDSEQGLEPMDMSTASSSSPASALRRSDRRWLRAMVLGLGFVLLAGAGAVTFLVGSSSVAPGTKAKVRQVVPFLEKQWRYINTCPREVTVEEYGADGEAAAAAPVELVYDGQPHITMFGDSITEMSFDPEQSGFSSMLANA